MLIQLKKQKGQRATFNDTQQIATFKKTRIFFPNFRCFHLLTRISPLPHGINTFSGVCKSVFFTHDISVKKIYCRCFFFLCDFFLFVCVFLLVSFVFGEGRRQTAAANFFLFSIFCPGKFFGYYCLPPQRTTEIDGDDVATSLHIYNTN